MNMFCTNCGRKVEIKTNYCPECGLNLSKNHITPNSLDPNPEKMEPIEYKKLDTSALIIKSVKMLFGNSATKSSIIINGNELPKKFMFGEEQSINIPTGNVTIQVKLNQANIINLKTNILTIDSKPNTTTILNLTPNTINTGFILKAVKATKIKNERNIKSLIFSGAIIILFIYKIAHEIGF